MIRGCSVDGQDLCLAQPMVRYETMLAGKVERPALGLALALELDMRTNSVVAEHRTRLSRILGLFFWSTTSHEQHDRTSFGLADEASIALRSESDIAWYNWVRNRSLAWFGGQRILEQRKADR